MFVAAILVFSSGQMHSSNGRCLLKIKLTEFLALTHELQPNEVLLFRASIVAFSTRKIEHMPRFLEKENIMDDRISYSCNENIWIGRVAWRATVNLGH